jgi:UTP-glucose-1-phosphate uridylyltransferase
MNWLFAASSRHHPLGVTFFLGCVNFHRAQVIAQLLRKEQVLAYRYQGTRYDCGSKLGFLQATVDLGQHHPQVGAEFSAWLAQRNA